MRKTLQGTGWSLMAAGSLGLLGQASAQGTTPPASTARSAVQLSIHGSKPATLSDAEQFLDQVNVELAWMADPVTFPYGMAAYCVGDAMQLRGYVPTDVIRQQALRIARQHTRLQVWDDLRVHPSSIRHEAPDSVEGLERSATDLLVAMDAEHRSTIAIKAQADGRVIVSGTIPSHEQKLAVSRALRRLHHCTSVQNDLTIPVVRRDGRSYTQVDREGLLLLPTTLSPSQHAESPAVHPPATVAPLSAPQVVAQAPSEPAPHHEMKAPAKLPDMLPSPEDGPSPKETHGDVVTMPRHEEKHGLPAAPSEAAPKRTSHAEALPPAAATKESGKPMPFQPWTPDEKSAESQKATEKATRSERPMPATMTLDPATTQPLQSAPKSAAPANSAKTETPKPRESYSQPYLQPTLAPVALPTSPKSNATNVGYVTTGTITLTEEPAPKAVPSPAQAVAKPATPVASVTPKPSVPPSTQTIVAKPAASTKVVDETPAVSQAKQPVPVGWPHQSTGTIAFAKEDPPARLAIPPSAVPQHSEPKPMPTEVAHPVQPATLPKLERPTVSAATPLQQQVTRRIEAVCGSRGHDVHVTVRPDSTWEITLKTASAQDARELWTKISDLAELAPYKVSLKVQVEP